MELWNATSVAAPAPHSSARARPVRCAPARAPRAQHRCTRRAALTHGRDTPRALSDVPAVSAAAQLAAWAAALALLLPAPAALAVLPAPQPPVLPAPARRAPAPRTALVRPKPPLTPDERATVQLFQSSTPGVVFITALVPGQDQFTLDAIEAPAGAGSGFFWDNQGHVVTNYHVVKGASQLRVTLGDASTVDASLVGFDEDKDVAVIKLQGEKALAIKPLPLGSSGDLQVGQRVFAIGCPFGLDHTLTSGLVSGLGREIASGTSGRPIDGVIQTDAAINPGNSGGPLLNSGGQVVGINTAIYSGSGTSSGVGFALPSDLVSGIVDQIIAFGHVTRPVLGISFAPDGVVTQLGLGGVLVLDVRESGPAAKAGLHGTTRDDSGRLQLGDVIVSVDGAAIKSSGDLYRALDKYTVGDTLQVGVERTGEPATTLAVVLEDKDLVLKPKS